MVFLKGVIMTILKLLSVCFLLVYPINDSNLVSIKNNLYSFNSESKVEKQRFLPNFYTTDHAEYFKINDFSVGRVGIKQIENYSLSYTILRPTFYYVMEFNYSYNDGDLILGDDDYYAPGPSYDYGDIVRTLSFNVDRDNYEAPFETFGIYIKCYTQKFSFEKIYSDQFISFSVVNAYHQINIKKASCKLPYLFSYSSVAQEGTITFDMLTFENYSSHLLDLLYFRIRLDSFYFSYCGPKSDSDFDFFIYNNNGSFDNVLNADFSLPLIQNIFSSNNFNLRYKNARLGGRFNLYLNPFTGLMNRHRSTVNFIEVNNLYLPLTKKYRYSFLSCGLKIKSFGNCSMSIKWDFDITFSGKIKDFYDSKIQFGKVIDDSALEEVPII